MSKSVDLKQAREKTLYFICCYSKLNAKITLHKKYVYNHDLL